MLLISDIKTSDGNFEVNLAAISRKVINRNSEKDFKRPSETDRCRDIGLVPALISEIRKS